MAKASTNAPQPFVGATIAAAGAKAIIKRVIVDGMERAAEKTNVPLAPKDVQKVADAQAMEMSRDPVTVNAMNAEPLWQSRIINGATVAALGVVIPIVTRWFGYEIAETEVIKIGGAVVTLAGIGYVIVGRTVRGLKPMWSRLRGQ